MKNISTVVILLMTSLSLAAQQTGDGSRHTPAEASALSDYVRLYRKFLDRGEGDGKCAMYPSCSRYGLMVFRDRAFPRAMVHMADRLIRCGHDFDCYDRTLHEGQVLLLDLPPYAEVPRSRILRDRTYYANINREMRSDSTLLFIQHLINKQMYQEALLEIERAQFMKQSLSEPLFTNKIICYKGLDQIENAIFDYEVRFPESIKKSPEIKFEMADILLQAEDYDRAQKLLSGIPDTHASNSILAQKYAWQGIISVYQEKWEVANKHFHLSANEQADTKRKEENERLIREAMTFRRKKPWVAATLSLVPGGGYLYTRRPKSALTALVMNSLLGYAVWTSIDRRNYGAAALFGVFNLSFYIGNLSGAKRSAAQYNERRLQKIQSILYQNNKSIL